MADCTVTAADVRPLNGAVIRRATATEALAFGDAVYIDSDTGTIPNVSKATGSAVNALLDVWGIAVAGNPANPGATSIAAADPVDVVVFGCVDGYAGGTPGYTAWLSDTKGKVSTTVGTKSCMIGKFESDGVLFVNPITAIKSS